MNQKLTSLQVDEIRVKIKDGVPLVEIAKAYNVSISCISDIKTGRKHKQGVGPSIYYRAYIDIYERIQQQKSIEGVDDEDIINYYLDKILPPLTVKKGV